MSPHLVTAALGHHDVGFTLRTYAHLLSGAPAEAMATIGALIFGPQATRLLVGTLAPNSTSSCRRPTSGGYRIEPLRPDGSSSAFAPPRFASSSFARLRFAPKRSSPERVSQKGSSLIDAALCEQKQLFHKGPNGFRSMHLDGLCSSTRMLCDHVMAISTSMCCSSSLSRVALMDLPDLSGPHSGPQRNNRSDGAFKKPRLTCILFVGLPRFELPTFGPPDRCTAIR
jgi:hypothetical protein